MHRYEIAISFAGEDRNVASAIADRLTAEGVRVFYDEYEQADLWGKDLYEYLAEVYSEHARYCIMLLSENYARKLWTNHERQNAQARAFRERAEYILPVKLDDTKIPGIRETVGYIDLRATTIDDLIPMILSKLGRKSGDAGGTGISASVPGINIPIPKIKKTFTQLEKDRFTKEGFGFILTYFKKGIERIRTLGEGLDADLLEVGELKFVAKLYRNGDVASQCKIWMGGAFSQNSICYSESFHDIHSDNSYNDWLTIEDDGYRLFFKPSGMWFRSSEDAEKALDGQQAAVYFWQRFTGPLGG